MKATSIILRVDEDGSFTEPVCKEHLLASLEAAPLMRWLGEDIAGVSGVVPCAECRRERLATRKDTCLTCGGAYVDGDCPRCEDEYLERSVHTLVCR